MQPTPNFFKQQVRAGCPLGISPMFCIPRFPSGGSVLLSRSSHKYRAAIHTPSHNRNARQLNRKSGYAPPSRGCLVSTLLAKTSTSMGLLGPCCPVCLHAMRCALSPTFLRAYKAHLRTAMCSEPNLLAGPQGAPPRHYFAFVPMPIIRLCLSLLACPSPFPLYRPACVLRRILTGLTIGSMCAASIDGLTVWLDGVRAIGVRALLKDILLGSDDLTHMYSEPNEVPRGDSSTSILQRLNREKLAGKQISSGRPN